MTGDMEYYASGEHLINGEADSYKEEGCYICGADIICSVNGVGWCFMHFLFRPRDDS